MYELLGMGEGFIGCKIMVPETYRNFGIKYECAMCMQDGRAKWMLNGRLLALHVVQLDKEFVFEHHERIHEKI